MDIGQGVALFNFVPTTSSKSPSPLGFNKFLHHAPFYFNNLEQIRPRLIKSFNLLIMTKTIVLIASNNTLCRYKKCANMNT